MKHRKILFVCTGNTCRSPMAEAAMKQELKKRKVSWYRVESAGLAASVGQPMSANSQQALREAKIAYREDFAAKQLTEEQIKGAHAVICMTAAGQQALSAFPNVTSFPALCGMEIPDPYGQSIDAYRVTLRHIRECLPKIIEVCCPKVEE